MTGTPRPAQIVAVERADIPGLFNVTLADGRQLTDLTTGQVDQLVAQDRAARQ